MQTRDLPHVARSAARACLRQRNGFIEQFQRAGAIAEDLFVEAGVVVAEEHDLKFIFDTLSPMTEAPFDLPSQMMLIFSDSAGSSGRGWGGHIPALGRTAHGLWPESLVHADIQVLELLATILVILEAKPENTPLCLLSDNRVRFIVFTVKEEQKTRS